MRTSVKFKLLPILIIGLALLTGIFYFTFVNVLEQNLHTINDDEIRTSKEMFYNLQDNDVKVLSSTLTALLSNNELRDVYLKNNREELFDFGYPLFSQLEEQFGITHFYFHYPNGTNFIRLHKKTEFGDKITRETFEKSVRINGFGTGLELGKTAFALRVVHPYYNGTNLIGYIELGEEIDHFLKYMKKQTGNEFGIFIKKEYINHEDWKSMRAINGLNDNYDSLKNYVVIDTTSDSISSYVANDEDKLSISIEDTFDKFQIDGNTYVTGGFPLYDASGKSVGTVVVVKDVTPLENAVGEGTRFVLFIAIFSAIAISLILILLVNKYILKPLDNIVEATDRVAEGDFSSEVKAQSNDEIGNLANSFNKMAINLEKSKNKIIESNKYIENIVICMNEALIVTSHDHIINKANTAACKMLNFNEEELIGQNISKIFPQKDSTSLNSNCLVQKNSSFETELLSKDSLKIPVILSNSVMSDHDKITGIIYIAHDITERKKNDAQILSSLREKELLLKEIHHRVKNNMQIISSLLSHQSEYTDDKRITEIFKDSQNRIASMSLIHEKLYRSKDLDKIDFADYITNLSASIFQSYDVNPGKITFNSKIDDIFLNIDYAIPCGLIINELITNSIKYAFPDEKKGNINVEFRHAGDKMYELIVSDNGKGLTKDIDFKRTKSLGLHLVTLLAEKQLHGTITLNQTNRTEFRIKFGAEYHAK